MCGALVGARGFIPHGNPALLGGRAEHETRPPAPRGKSGAGASRSDAAAPPGRALAAGSGGSPAPIWPPHAEGSQAAALGVSPAGAPSWGGCLTSGRSVPSLGLGVLSQQVALCPPHRTGRGARGRDRPELTPLSVPWRRAGSQLSWGHRTPPVMHAHRGARSHMPLVSRWRASVCHRGGPSPSACGKSGPSGPVF